MTAVLAVWIALGALITTIVVFAYPWTGREAVITLLPYTIALSATLAAAVLWALRHQPITEPGVAGRRLQAWTAIGLNSVSFAISLFALQSPKHAVAGLAIEFGFLWICWWSYKNVVLRE